MSVFAYGVVSLYLFVIGNVICQPEICNPIECFKLLDTIFQAHDHDEACQWMTKLERCVTLCSSNKTDNYVLHGLNSVKKDACSDAFNVLGSKCEEKHKYRLLACVYERLYEEAKDVNTSEKLLICRRGIYGRSCSSDMATLSKCHDHLDQHGNLDPLASLLLESFFRQMYETNCITFNLKDLDDLKLKPLDYIEDYKNLAECLDKNTLLVTDCVPNKLVVGNALADTYFEKKICRAAWSFLGCIQGVILKKCTELEPTFSAIAESLSSNLLPHCAEAKADDKLSNIVYEQASLADTDQQEKDESETVVVHQHIVMKVHYFNISAASLSTVLHLFVILFALGLQLCSNFINK